jgi:hypothetical protein
MFTSPGSIDFLIGMCPLEVVALIITIRCFSLPPDKMIEFIKDFGWTLIVYRLSTCFLMVKEVFRPVAYSDCTFFLLYQLLNLLILLGLLFIKYRSLKKRNYIGD